MSCPLSMADCHSSCQSKMIKKMCKTITIAVSHECPQYREEKASIQCFPFYTIVDNKCISEFFFFYKMK